MERKKKESLHFDQINFLKLELYRAQKNKADRFVWEANMTEEGLKLFPYKI